MTMPAGGRPGKGWPVRPLGPPPAGPPPGWRPPDVPPPGRRGPRWGIIAALALVLVLVAGASVSAWAYATGRLGVGPLSAMDEAAATAIADGAEGPEWADSDLRECAADELVHDTRSPDLEKHGLIEPDGDGWTYTGEWRLQEATTYVEALLDCSDDWAARVGDAWELEDTDCLEDLGTSAVADYFVAETLSVVDDEDSAQEARDRAVAGLDECYVDEAPGPRAKPRPAYRAVGFRFRDPAPDAGRASLLVRADGDWMPLDSRKHTVATAAGGRRGCIEARMETTYPWGSSSSTDKRFCGRSKPARIWWVRARKCTYTPGCTKWDLRYEGFESFDAATVRVFENGGDCNSESGECSQVFLTSTEGRGTAFSWSVYPGYDEHFVARVGRMSAVLPD